MGTLLPHLYITQIHVFSIGHIKTYVWDLSNQAFSGGEH